MSKYQKARKLSLEFFYRHAFTIGVCAFIASLIFSCTFTLQFADDWPRNIPIYEYLISNAVWSRFSLFLAGFALMGGQIITFVMYKKAKKTWVFGLYCGLTFLSICATFGSFATGLEGRRIAVAKADTGITSLINNRDNIQKMIDQQNAMIDRYMALDNPKITASDRVGNKVKENIILLNQANKEIKEYSSSDSGATTGDVITRMFYRTATVIQTLYGLFGDMPDETRDTVAMLLECFSFIMLAVLLDLVAAFCAAISVRVDEEDFNQVIMDESMEQQHASNFAYAREQNRLTHEARMADVKALPLQNMPTPMTASAASTPQAPQTVVPPETQQPQASQKTPPPISHSYTSSNSAPSPAPEKVASSRSVAPLTAKSEPLPAIKLSEIPKVRRVKEVKIPKSSTSKPASKKETVEKKTTPKEAQAKKAKPKAKKGFKFDKATILLYVENAWRKNTHIHNAWLGRDTIGTHTGIKKSMREKIHNWLKSNDLIHVKKTNTQMWTIPNFSKAEMLKKIKALNIN